ncbi:hypothetical protein [Microbacterium dauci]|uniref:Signal transduction histidine kinase n=1 Tax=Microbacterium dauci TaxID=3048008 RepID=A0ABT6ZE48_9MICO|nr:hypothetical protein [Microbacterium sp. LX3-4]MDJ1114443.1 hypothetical protein [Microbacterium sp. LX3-4]
MPASPRPRAARRPFHRVAQAVLGTLRSGEYFTRWSLILAFIVGTFLSVPSVGEPSLIGYAKGVLVAALGFLPLAIIGGFGAMAERRLTSGGARIVVIAITIVAIAALRPFVNDAISLGLFDTATGANWPSRITTNVITSFALLSICAIAVSYHRQLRATTARLRDAGGRMRAGIAHADRMLTGIPDLLHSTAVDLRTHRDLLLSGPLTYEAVRAFCERVRTASHRLDEHGRTDPPPTSEVTVQGTRPVPLLGRLAPTPPLVVCLTYVAAALPFGIAHGGMDVIVITLVVAVVLDLAAGVAVRATRRLAPRPRGVVFLSIWFVVGVGVVCHTYIQVPQVGTLGLVPLIGIPLVAVIISVSVDAYRRARSEELRATAQLRSSAVELAAAVEAARAPLQQAVDILHGRLQGRCVIFAARIDDGQLDDATIATFRVETDDILDYLLRSTSDADADGETVDDLLQAWSVVMRVQADTDDDARAALTDPHARRAAVGLVNEALVNAVKHSAARAASVRISQADDAIRVRVSSAGTLGTGVHGLGGQTARTTLRQVGDDVVLEGLVSVGDA